MVFDTLTLVFFLSEECVHGTIYNRTAEVPCVCDDGYTGGNCDEECSGHGTRQGDGTCDCDIGYRGSVRKSRSKSMETIILFGW